MVSAIVADLRVGEDNDLPSVRGICEDFLIAGDRGIENDFAQALGGCAEADTFKDTAVFQGEDCLLQPIGS